MNGIPGFTAEASLYDRPTLYWIYGDSYALVSTDKVLPQQSGYQCGNQFLNTVCPFLLNAGYLACWYACMWDRYSSICRTCVIAHAPICRDCTGI
jgi:hypothetical protein